MASKTNRLGFAVFPPWSKKDAMGDDESLILYLLADGPIIITFALASYGSLRNGMSAAMLKRLKRAVL